MTALVLMTLAFVGLGLAIARWGTDSRSGCGEWRWGCGG